MKIIFLTALVFWCRFLFAQDVVPEISARIDTTDSNVKHVCGLMRDYFNSVPDSIYRNPNWNEAENTFYVNRGARPDRAAYFMSTIAPSADFYSYYKPMLLQVEEADENRFLVKTIYRALSPEADYVPHSVPYITRHYAVKDKGGKFRLENSMVYDTRDWQRKTYKFINYIVHPDCHFDKKQAKQAVRFCEDVARRFHLKIEPFSYYILPDSDALGKLQNFEFWTYYQTGFTNMGLREIFTTFGSASYPHEFVHLLFPMKTDAKQYTPVIINEGLATWLGDPGFDISFADALTEVSRKFKTTPDVTLDKIMSFEIRNEMDNNVLYVTGAVICKLAFEKGGADAVWRLYNSNNETFKTELSLVFDKPIAAAEQEVLDYIIARP